MKLVPEKICGDENAMDRSRSPDGIGVLLVLDGLLLASSIISALMGVIIDSGLFAGYVRGYRLMVSCRNS